ncbi:MAG: class I SAM-dependent methyltransferase [bacterium]
METKFESINCPLCGSHRNQPKFKAPDRFNLDSGIDYHIVICLNCQFIYLNPRPMAEFISEFYTNGAYQPFLSTKASLNIWDIIYRWLRNYSVRWKRRKIEKLKTKGKILDIGCGTGEFLHEMKRHGWEVEGIEKDQRAAEFAQKEYGLKVSTDDLNELTILKKKFDIITMWHVLEHLFQPLDTLNIVKKILEDDGFLLIAAPNVVSFDANFYRDNWVALDAPRHLQHFVPKSLTVFSEAAELEIFNFQQMPLDAFYNCLMSELLILTKYAKLKILQPFFLLRAIGIALISIIKSSRYLNKKNRLGSSILYFIQKQRVEK